MSASELRKYDSVIQSVQKFTGLKPYLVGGAVRDSLLGKPSKDIDLTVVGNEDHLRKLGFTPIKKDFPVFQHKDFPGIEVALARGEKKVGDGHSGFSWYTAKDLSTDLARRDLTVNALAYHPDDGVIDHHGGIADLHSKTLRHVSSAFSEDPLRTFRTARFASKLGFDVHPSTVQAMKDVAHELPTLSKERVRDEYEKAMSTQAPHKFFSVLKDADSLSHWFPEVDNLRTVPSKFSSTTAYGHAQNGLKKAESLQVKHALLTQEMPDFGHSFLSRLGYPERHKSHMMTHGALAEVPFSPPKNSKDSVVYWRGVKHIQDLHRDATRINSELSGKPENFSSHYEPLFNTLKTTKIPPKLNVDDILGLYNSAAASHLRESLDSSEFVTILLESELYDLFCV